MIQDVQNDYSGTRTLSGGTTTVAGQALTVGTTPSTNVIDHSPSLSAQGNHQNVQIGLGIGMAVVLEVTVAPVTGNSETYTANFFTSSVATDTTPGAGTCVTLATLTISPTAAVGTQYVLMVPASLNFKRFSGVSYTLAVGTATISVLATLMPVKFIQNTINYESGWVIQNS